MLETAHFNAPPPNMGMSQMPPPMGGVPPNLSLPPPNLAVPPPNMPGHPGHHFNRYNSGGPPAGIPQQGPRGQHFFQPFRPYPRPTLDPEFDGKRLRKSVMRKTVDYNAAIIKLLEVSTFYDIFYLQCKFHNSFSSLILKKKKLFFSAVKSLATRFQRPESTAT